jgi:hypothetical protein
VSILSLINMTISKYLKACVFVLVQLAGLCVTAVCEDQRTSFFERSAPELVNGHRSWLIADFDGDYIPDLAMGRNEHSCYQVEVQLSSERASAPVHQGHIDAGVKLFVYDIDQDDDQDLVLTSLTSLSPAAVWLNDGKGHFDETDVFTDFKMVCEHRSSLETESAQAEPASVTQDDDRPFDRSSVQQDCVVLSIASLLIRRWRDFAIELSPYHSSPRGPPRIPAFLS